MTPPDPRQIVLLGSGFMGNGAGGARVTRSSRRCCPSPADPIRGCAWFDLAPFTAGLAFLPGSYTPHYDSEDRRRPALQRLVADGTLAPGWASDDGAAMRFVGTELADVFCDRDGAAVYRVEPGAEQRIEPRRLP